MSQTTIAPRTESSTPPDVQQSIDRIVPVLMQYTQEEIDGMRARLEALLARRQPQTHPPNPASA